MYKAEKFTNLSGSGILSGRGAYAIDGTFSYTGDGIDTIGLNTHVSLDARGTGIEASIVDGAGTDALSGLDGLAGSLALSGLVQSETVAEGAGDFQGRFSRDPFDRRGLQRPV